MGELSRKEDVVISRLKEANGRFIRDIKTLCDENDRLTRQYEELRTVLANLVLGASPRYQPNDNEHQCLLCFCSVRTSEKGEKQELIKHDSDCDYETARALIANHDAELEGEDESSSTK